MRETPPPTETPILTPTLHPDFVALQNLISDSSNLVLLPDGTIEQTTADGGRQTVPNLHVDQNGVINIIFNNERVVIEISKISFDDERGLTIEGYEQNENGEWVEAQETFTTQDGLKVVLGEEGTDGNAIIEKIIPPAELSAEQSATLLTQFDETRLGLEGDWVKTADGRIVLLDDVADPESILAEYKIFEQTGTMQVVVDASKLMVDGENVILSQAEIEEWRNGLPVNYEKVQELNVEMIKEANPLLNNLLVSQGFELIDAWIPAGYILSSDGKQGVSIRYKVYPSSGVTDTNSARFSSEGVVFFRNNEGGYTYFFVENFELQYIK